MAGFLKESFLSSDLQVNDEETNEEEYGENFATNCRQGKHEFILDEEIGIKCINCSFLKVEIRFVLPPMVSTPSLQRHDNLF